jgi:hypothetical protein
LVSASVAPLDFNPVEGDDDEHEQVQTAV